ncbi:MAG: 3-phosphoshikimate 1-carboxyvinyltransferase, partial [Oscillospiraceae bacterium]|nr:3-phosphoshikimate 1-carboxyvinyltransferase [Oscillospiraceae bacterium]
MTREIMPGQRTGEIRIPASKSVSHRMLILAALGDKDVTLKLDGVSSDIRATAECLAALGAGISEAEGKIEVSPIRAAPSGARVLRCRDSGATLRFLMPVAGALGAETVFIREGRLPKRPLEPFG